MVAKKRRSPGRPRAGNNHFGRWIDAQGLTREQVAEKLGLTTAALNYLCRGARLPGLKVAFDIEKLTDGAISARSWLKLTIPKHK